MKLAEDISLLTFLEAIDLDLLLTEMNEATVDMHCIMRKFKSVKPNIILVDLGLNKPKVVNIICIAMDLSLEEANKIIEDNPIPLLEFTDVDIAIMVRDKLNAEGATAKIKYVYEEG